MPSPADLLTLPFMRDALFELALLAVAGGVLGAWIVLRRLAFFSHAVGSATFPALVVADASGVSATLAGLAMGLVYAGGVQLAGRTHVGANASRGTGDGGSAAVRRRTRVVANPPRGTGDLSEATALLLVAALALGVVLASDVFESGAGVDRLLFGTLLGLTTGDLVLSAAVAAAALVGALALGRSWTALAFDPDAAPGLGVPAGRADLALLVLVAVAAVAAIPAVGALLVAAIYVLPAAAARLFTRTIPSLIGWAIAIAAAESLVGLYLALWLDLPPGPPIATLGAAVYGTLAIGQNLTAHRRRQSPLVAT